MADRVPGVFGTDPPVGRESTGDPDEMPRGGGADVAPNGFDPPSPIPLVARIIAKVVDDWHPPSPNTTPTISLEADNLADLATLLKPLKEWGQGGGALRSERIPVGTSTNLTVTLHGNLVLRLPEWTNYSKASAPARKEWDRMISKLKAHEQRHMDIAIEHGDTLAKGLVGEDIDVIEKRVTAANAAIAKDQKKLDDDTDHGAKKGVTYGDVFLDTSID
jgi:hypothetical protein